jgi:hypothetical protein
VSVTLRPARKTPKTTPRTTPVGTPEDRRPRRASAYGTDDPYCHVLVGGNRYTRCGIRLKPPLTQHETHSAKGNCPNGHPSCPECGPR